MNEPGEQVLPSEEPLAPSAPVSPAKPPEAQPAPAVSEAPKGLDEASQKRIEAAERKTEETERRLRQLQSAKDAEIAQTRKETRAQMQRERAALAQLLESAGVSKEQLTAFQAQRSHEDEADDLRQQNQMYQGQLAQQQAEQVRQQYVATQCAEFGIDPNDRRLNLDTPEAFALSLANIVRQDAAKAGKQPAPAPTAADPAAPLTPAPPTPAPAKAAKNDLDMLGGGGSGGSNDQLPDDPDELWDTAKKSVPSLRGRS